MDDIRPRRDSGIRNVGAGNDARNIRPVTIVIAGVAVVVGKIILINNAVGDTVAVGIRPEEGVIQINAGIQNHRRKTAAIDAGKAGIVAELIQTDQAGGRCSGSREGTGKVADTGQINRFR